ncbi:MAG: SRPBCC domain-containing protein [Flavobacteriales bacterium]|nr:SRPBCC domain-containing protein [Flavobacteriales bacterium]MBL0044344.1 SRPBCC domain-containing protein [Flavobacteriales bacterium]
MAIKTSSFKQQVTLNATPQAIYDILMDSKAHTKLTGAKATISAKAGGAFAAYDGYAFGKNIDLLPGKLIVQTWRAKEDQWPVDHDSIIVFHLNALGKSRTKLVFEHREVPADLAGNFKQGWIDFYWIPLKKKFNGK